MTTESDQQAWADAARPILTQIAARYGALITTKELALQVQDASDVRTKRLAHYWIGGVLESVAQECRKREEPMLSAFCVKADGTIGPGYTEAVTELLGTTPPDIDLYAAQERFEGHKHFGAKMPADGGRPQLSPQISRSRAAAARRTREDFVRPVCPIHHLALPATGLCDLCNE
ncbi:MAG: hypothetical protein SGJ13_10190 [Actinomycetota bacterium]|nr:hypothetical protein [Actinomycetota bacterium]